MPGKTCEIYAVYAILDVLFWLRKNCVERTLKEGYKLEKRRVVS